MTRRIASSNSFWENLAPLALACLAPEFSLCEPNNAFQYPNKLSIMEDFSDGPPTDINPYHVLEIETMASASEVKSAYKKLALRHHPGMS